MKETVHALATVAEVFEDGITLIFDGQTEASMKKYKHQTAITFSAGQRVKVIKMSGTYIVEYPIS